MKIDIEALGIDADPDMRRCVERCAKSAFGVHRNRIEALRIRLVEVDQACDGRVHSCLVQVSLPGRHKLIAEVMDSDLRVATHRAVDRAGWTAARWLQRRERQAGQLTIVGHHLAGYPDSEQAA